MMYGPETNFVPDAFTPMNDQSLRTQQKIPCAPNGLTNEAMSAAPEIFQQRSSLDQSVMAQKFVKSDSYKQSVDRARKLSDSIEKSNPKKK